MKTTSAFAILWLSAFLVWGQQSETREPGSFSGVRVSEGIDVFLEKGDRESVRVEVEGTALSNIITEISGGYLKIHRKGSLFGDIEARVWVTYVNIDKLSASSAGSIYSEQPIQARNMLINASSAGSIEVALDAGSADVSCSSAGDVELKGKVRKLKLAASSAGEVDAFDLEADEVDAEASSGASVKFNVSHSLKARASSGGSIRFRGNPETSNTNSSSGGSVRKL
jgi:hypothetical protein